MSQEHTLAHPRGFLHANFQMYAHLSIRADSHFDLGCWHIPMRFRTY